MSHAEFWKSTYQEFWISFLKYFKEQEIQKVRREDEIWKYGDIKAHIAWCMGLKKEDGSQWSYSDFVTLPGDRGKVKEKLSLKEARQLLGSTFKMSNN